MKITVTGKAHMQGTSKKTGNPYNFIQLHYNGPARNVVGLGAMTVNIDPSMARYDAITVPGDYNIEFDHRGFPVEFSAIPASGK